MNRVVMQVVILANVLFLNVACAQSISAKAIVFSEYEWQLKRDEKAIKIYTSPVKNSPFKAVRASMEVNATTAELMALVNDFSACPLWVDLCKSSTMMKQLSPLEYYAYIYNDIPFPVKDRDVVAHLVWARDANTGQVSMVSRALGAEKSQKVMALNSKAVRIVNAKSAWFFTPLNNGAEDQVDGKREQAKTRVDSFAHIDPNGPTPAWLINMLLVGSPMKTMIKMRKIIESGRYKRAKRVFE